MATTTLLRSFANDALDQATGALQWTLFVRQRTVDADGGSAFTFTVVASPGTASERSTCTVYERQLDRAAMEQHIDELGIEVKTAAFTELLLKTLASRKCVDFRIDSADDDENVSVMLTYKFSETISRRGQVTLERVAQRVPLAVARLLYDVHMVQNEPVMTESQALQKQLAAKQKTSASAPVARSAALSLSQESNQSTDGDAAIAPISEKPASTGVNPHVLKRRHVPTGTVRRKGPRGAKLAKLE